MSIQYLVEGVKKPNLQYRLVSKWLKLIIEKFSLKVGDITYIFCSDDYLLEINTKYLNHNYYTDIITFDYCSANIVSGDLFISVDRILENSVIFGNEISNEFLRVIVHGVLHLLGYKDSDESEKIIMRNAENEFIIVFEKLRNEFIK